MKLVDIIRELLDRSQMPQVHRDDMPKAFSILSDNGITVKMVSVLPSRLKHSQTKVNNKKVSSIIKDITSGKKMPPIVASQDGWIVDGHHRQVAYNTIQPKNTIRVVVIGLKRDAAISAYKQVSDVV